MRTCAYCVLLCGGILFSQRVVADQTAQDLEHEEVRQCSKNLHLIYEAIQAYRRVNKDVPTELAELTPHFLSKVHLICPGARRLGLTSADLVGWGPTGPATYDYEFTPRLIPPIISGGAQWSMREWKQLQMGLLGSDVPIVRCHTHKRVLNLSFGGRIFESASVDWEQNFTDVVRREDLTFAKRFAAWTVVKKIIVPARNPQALATLIDLSTEYNALLDEIWPSCEPLRPLSGLPPGLAEFDHTGFDIRGAIQLGALRPGLIPYPVAVTNIVIGLHGARVHLLLGTVYAAPPETPVAECIFHLSDGRRQRLQLLYGTHLATLILPASEASAPLRDAKIAWSASLSDGSVARLFQCEWINPAPAQRIESVDFLARAGNTGPLLVALSTE